MILSLNPVIDIEILLGVEVDKDVENICILTTLMEFQHVKILYLHISFSVFFF